MKILKILMKKAGIKLFVLFLSSCVFMGAMTAPFIAFGAWKKNISGSGDDMPFGSYGASLSLNENVSGKVFQHEEAVEKWLPESMNGYYDLQNYKYAILAIMNVESGGKGKDPMQSSQCSKNTRYPRKANGITDVSYSIECGVREFADLMSQVTQTGVSEKDAILISLDAYNKGAGIIAEHTAGGGYDFAVSCRYCHDHATGKKKYSTASSLKEKFSLQTNEHWDGGSWRWNYGNMFYVYAIMSCLNIYEGVRDDGSTGSLITQTAMSKLGAPYWWGKSGPDYFDCSGFVCWVYNQAGIELPRLTAHGYSTYGTSIRFQDLAPGDIVTFDWGGDGRVDHVGIYIGDSYMIHASGNSSVRGNSSRHVVKKQALTDYYVRHVSSCRRFF